MRAPTLAEHYEDKTATYATFGNGVVADTALALLPAGGRVLDIGCASGGLLALLRDRADYAAGIELSESAAAAARAVADEVVSLPVEHPDVPFTDASFDLIVLADVLEHVAVPGAALARAARWLKPGGTALVCVPNIAHWQARLTVLRGDWRTDPSGTFDEGHLRFFNVARLDELLRDAGLTEIALRPIVPALRNHLPALRRLPAGVQRQLERGWQAAGARRPNLLGYQLVGTGRRSPLTSR